MLLAKGDTLLFIGDSITDAGRNQPVGGHSLSSLGTGYVYFLGALLDARVPELAIKVLNTGRSGNTVRDLAGRWQTDVIDLKPIVLGIMIGTNDVWRQFDDPKNPNASVLPEEYRDTLDHLVELTKPKVKEILLMTPFYIEPDEGEPMRARMDEYGRLVRAVAKKHQTRFLDIQAVYNRLLQTQHSSAIGWDRVHPNAAGHMAMALAVYESLE
ncbi:MAG: SGNH/GDSL hydrolase family protein [Fimbriimonas sp.]